MSENILNKSKEDPFARRKGPKKESTSPVQNIKCTPDGLGKVSEVDDTLRDDLSKLEGLVPQEASLDEGYNKMLSIMGVDPKKAKTAQERRQQAASILNTPPIETVSDPIGTALDGPRMTDPQTVKTPEPVKEETPTYTDEELLPYIDALFTLGYITDEFMMRGAKVVLKTTFTWEEQMVLTKLDEYTQDHRLNSAVDLMYQKFMLAAAIQTIGGASFKPIREGDPVQLEKHFDARVEVLNTLPTPIVQFLWTKYTNFAQKVSYATKEFERLIKVF